MGFWGWWVLLSALAVMAFIAKAVRDIRYPKASQSRGTVPGHGNSIIDSGTGELTYTPTLSVTKDPQEYAKGMMPGGRT
ncbi:hypothetical protein [Halocynthiibacter styelae]|uniref:Uncharacterized protein n=1 Tax=Halocynthiibacter styelae TaxID=2761955 RepID=A0A8J7IC72_9RHOB|nr:hypothetical protein [Paenihalocynthiibacter styelae]MBI1492389.1 hypothetical protein [Paenihalocynthiibacter styelae]